MNTHRIEHIIMTLRVRSTTGKQQERLASILTAYDQWQQSRTAAQRSRRMVYRWTAGLATAALITIVIALAVLYKSPARILPDQTKTRTMSSPTEIVTAGSLQTAFHQGGLEGVERQLDRAAKLYGPWPSNLHELDLL